MYKQEIKKLEQKIVIKINDYSNSKDTLILGLSGGADSVFLFHMLLLTKSSFISAHLNHNLRGEESKRDQVFCTRLCKNHNKSIKIKTLDIEKIAKSSKKGIEETGRIERYKFFKDLAKKHKAKLIITAHHADDNAETIIKNLSRGSSLSGLSGIKELQNNIFRPLLEISKNEIIDYLKTKKIPFINDSSNEDKKYQRNFIRHEIMPLFLKLNPSFPKTITKNIKIIKEIEDFLDLHTQTFLKNKNKFSAKEFNLLAPAIKRHALKTILKNNEIESTHIEEIIQLISKNHGKKEKSYKNIQIKINKSIVSIEMS
jgi:tRNA(Ile)-lysidine synthase